MGGNVETRIANRLAESVQGRITALRETGTHKHAMTIMNDEVAKVKRERRERYMLRRQSASHKVKQAVVGATTEFVNTDFVKKNA